MKLKNIYQRQWISLALTAVLAILTNTAVIYSLFPDNVSHELLLISGILLFLSLVILNLLSQYIVKRAEAHTATEYLDYQPLNQSFPLISRIIEKERDAFRREISQIKVTNQELVQISTHDQLTLLKNRHAFHVEIDGYLRRNDKNVHAIFALIRATELQQINQQLGRDTGDQYLKMIAEILSHVAQRFSSEHVYRLSGSDFALFVPNATPSIAPLIGKELKELFDHLQIKMSLASTASTGITLVAPGEMVEQVLSRADLALAKSQVTHINSWYIQEFDADTPYSGEMHWRDVLLSVIDSNQITFTGQLIQPIKMNQHLYMQVSPTFMSKDLEPLSADSLYSIAMRHSLIDKLEQVLIRQLMQTKADQHDNQQLWGINLSANALFDTHFMTWLERLLEKDRAFASQLVFEVNEEYLELHRATAGRLFEILHQCGSRACIAKFGKGLSSFYLFRELKPNYVKLDSSILDGIADTPATQQFIKMLIDSVHKAGASVIIDNVDTREQKEMAEKLFIDGLQGSLCSRSISLSPSAKQ